MPLQQRVHPQQHRLTQLKASLLQPVGVLGGQCVPERDERLRVGLPYRIPQLPVQLVDRLGGERQKLLQLRLDTVPEELGIRLECLVGPTERGTQLGQHLRLEVTHHQIDGGFRPTFLVSGLLEP